MFICICMCLFVMRDFNCFSFCDVRRHLWWELTGEQLLDGI